MLTAEAQHIRTCEGWAYYVHTRAQKECSVCDFTWTDQQMFSFPTCILCNVTISPTRRRCDCK